MPINEEIRDKEVRVIDTDGSQLGIMSARDAYKIALGKNQKTIDIKEIRLSLNIDVNDFNTKVKQAIKFLEGGDKVKVSIRFRGREMAHPELGTTIMQRFTESVAGYGTVEKQPKLEGRSMTMFVTAKNGK